MKENTPSRNTGSMVFNGVSISLHISVSQNALGFAVRDLYDALEIEPDRLMTSRMKRQHYVPQSADDIFDYIRDTKPQRPLMYDSDRTLREKRYFCRKYFVYNPVRGRCQPTLLVSTSLI